MFSQLEELSLLPDGAPAAHATAPVLPASGRPSAISALASRGLARPAMEDSEYDDDSLNVGILLPADAVRGAPSLSRSTPVAREEDGKASPGGVRGCGVQVAGGGRAWLG